MQIIEEFFKNLKSIPSKNRIEILLLFLQEIGGTLQHLNTVGSGWGAEVKQDRVEERQKYYLELASKIKNLILEEYDQKS